MTREIPPAPVKCCPLPHIRNPRADSRANSTDEVFVMPPAPKLALLLDFGARYATACPAHPGDLRFYTTHGCSDARGHVASAWATSYGTGAFAGVLPCV